MRFLAVVMVLFTHANMFPASRKFLINVPDPFFTPLNMLHKGTWAGVDLFFVLSGFLVSGLLFQELARTGTVFPGRFLIRRGFKIYPAFWVMLMAAIIWTWHSGGLITLKGVLTELFFLQNYMPGPPPSCMATICGITWTLAVEEHFYFMLAGIFWILKKRAALNQAVNVHVIPKLFWCVAIACLLARLVTWAVVPAYVQKYYIWIIYATHVRMDSLFFGVLLAYYWHNRWDENFKNRLMAYRWLFAGVGLVLLSPAMFLDDAWTRIIGFSLIYVGAGCLLISFLSLDRFAQKDTGIRGVAWLGKHSYSVYLWHILAGSCLLPFVAIKTRSMPGFTLNLLIFIVLCWSIGVAMSSLIEFPMLRIRDRLFPWLRSRSPAG